MLLEHGDVGRVERRDDRVVQRRLFERPPRALQLPALQMEGRVREPAGRARMVVVGVGEDHRVDVLRPHPHLGEHDVGRLVVDDVVVVVPGLVRGPDVVPDVDQDLVAGALDVDVAVGERPGPPRPLAVEDAPQGLGRAAAVFQHPQRVRRHGNSSSSAAGTSTAVRGRFSACLSNRFLKRLGNVSENDYRRTLGRASGGVNHAVHSGPRTVSAWQRRGPAQPRRSAPGRADGSCRAQRASWTAERAAARRAPSR